MRTYSSCVSDCCLRPCLGTDHDPQRRYSHPGTFNSAYFHYDHLHDDLQFPGGELSSRLFRSPAACQRSGASPKLEPSRGNRNGDLEHVSKLGGGCALNSPSR